MRAVVERASAFEPSARYQSAAELARALGAEVADAAAPTAEKDETPQAAVEFAAAASALKHTIFGDYNRVSVSDVLTLAGGDGSGRVQR